MKQYASAECVPAHAKRAVKVLVCTKSIAEKLGMTHVSSAFQVEPSRAAVLYRLWSRTRRVAQSAPALSSHDPRKRSARPAFAIRGHRAQAEKVNGRGGLRRRNSNRHCIRSNSDYIALSAATAADLSLVTRPVCSGGPSPFQGSWQ